MVSYTSEVSGTLQMILDAILKNFWKGVIVFDNFRNFLEGWEPF